MPGYCVINTRIQMLPKGFCRDSPSLLPKGHYIQQSPKMSRQQRDRIVAELRDPFVVAGVETHLSVSTFNGGEEIILFWKFSYPPLQLPCDYSRTITTETCSSCGKPTLLSSVVAPWTAAVCCGRGEAVIRGLTEITSLERQSSPVSSSLWNRQKNLTESCSVLIQQHGILEGFQPKVGLGNNMVAHSQKWLDSY